TSTPKRIAVAWREAAGVLQTAPVTARVTPVEVSCPVTSQQQGAPQAITISPAAQVQEQLAAAISSKVEDKTQLPAPLRRRSSGANPPPQPAAVGQNRRSPAARQVAEKPQQQPASPRSRPPVAKVGQPAISESSQLWPFWVVLAALGGIALRVVPFNPA